MKDFELAAPGAAVVPTSLAFSFSRPRLFLLFLAFWLAAGWAQAGGLTWVDRRIPMDAPYAQHITGNAQITLIASTAGGIPSFAWSEDGMVWRQSFVPASQEGSYEFIAGAAAIGDRWVAVGAGGVNLVSEDNALTWERLPRVKNGAVNFSGVMAAGQTFVAFGKESRPGPEEGFVEGAAIFLSEDFGLSWETVEIPESSALLTGAAWGDVWVVAGEDGLICVSRDAGESWEVTNWEGGGSFTSAAAGQGVFLLVGPQGLVLRSADAGESWQVIYPGGSDWIQGVAFGAGKFVLSGGTNTQAGSSSVDGLNWVPAAGTGAWGTIGYGPSGFLAVGGTYGRQTTVTPVPQLTRTPAVFRGTVGRNFRASLRSARRGARFQATGLPPGLELNRSSGAIAGGPTSPGIFPAFLYATVQGSGGDAVQTLFEISDPAGNPGEALVWRSTPSGLKGWNFQPVAGSYADGVFVVVGETWTGQPLIVRSFDGRQWVGTVPPVNTPTENGWGLLKAVAGADGIWLAGGVDSNLWRSVDGGATWTQLPKLTDKFFDLTGLAMRGDTVVAVGKLARESGGEGAGIFFSEDAGLTWEAVEVEEFPALRGVTSYEDGWLAVGERGVILQAWHPAFSWDLLDSGVLQTLRVVHATRFVMLAWGEAGLLLRSTDQGETWEPVSAGSGYWPGTIASSEGFIVLSGGEKAAGCSSRDGRSWTLPQEAGAYGVVMAGPTGFFALNGDDVWFASGPWRPGVFTPDFSAGFSVGESLNVFLEATGDPSLWRVTGLPRGVTLDPASGEISGTIRQSGRVQLRIQARNQAGGGAGWSAPRIVALEIANPFSAVAGTYAVPIPFDLTAANEPLRRGGWLQIQVNHLGVFTGRLRLAHGETALRGEFDNLGQAVVELPPELFPGTLLKLVLPLDEPDEGTIESTFLNFFPAVFTGEKNPWNARTRPATLWQGLFTTSLAPEAEPITEIAGYVSHSVQGNGNFRLTARTEDGTAFSFSGFVMADGSVPFFAVQGRERALLTGKFAPDADSAAQEFHDQILWSAEASGAPALREARGARYVRPDAGQLLWGLPLVAENAELAFGAVSSGVSLVSGNRVVLPSDAPARSVALQIPRGTWSGRALDPSGQTIPFHGVILSAPWNAAAGLTNGRETPLPVTLRPASP